GVHDWPLESARQSIDCAKARRNFSLELRLDREPDVRCGIGLYARFRAEEIEIAPDRATDVERNVERLKMRIRRLEPDPVLAVLNDCIGHSKLARRCEHIVGAIAFVKEIAGETKFPVVIRIVNERWFRKHAFQSQMI